MWKTFQFDGQLYLYKTSKENGLTFLLSDLKSLWGQRFTNDELLTKFQSLNPSLDLKLDEVLDEVFNISCNLSILENVALTTLNDNSSVQINLTDTKGKFKVLFSFNLCKEAADNFLKEFIVPLMQSVKMLEEQKKVLCNVIQRKDRELEEYRLEKGTLSRDDLVTQPFEESKLEVTENQFEPSFWNAFQEKYGVVNTTLKKVPTQPWNNVKRKRTVISSRNVKKYGKGVNYTKF